METNWTIAGGTIYDGSGKAGFRGDVKISGSTIAAIGKTNIADNAQVFDATGLLVVPGLIDFHAHVYDGMNIHSLAPAEAGLKTGVTTIVDMGSAGAATYGTFEKYVIPAAKESIFAFLNISQYGVHGEADIPPYFGELHDPAQFDVTTVVQCANERREHIVGIKLRLSADIADDDIEKERAALAAALTARDKTGLPLCVHHVISSIPLEELLPQLNEDDVLTHVYHGFRDGSFDETTGAPRPCLVDACNRGVKFDVGHGGGSFAWRVAEPAIRDYGFLPHTISTDLHRFSLEKPVVDLPTTMSKFLHLGVPLERIIQATTYTPASIIGRDNEYGLLEVGRNADVTVLRVVEGEHRLIDSEGVERIVTHRLVPVCVFKNGQYHKREANYA